MPSQYSRINRATDEFKNFLEYYRDEYEDAYKYMRPGQGWVIPYRAEYIFELANSMYGSLYDSIHPLLFAEEPATDEDLLDRFKGLSAYLEKQEVEFEDIAEHHEEKVLDANISTVYGLYRKLRYKLREIIRLAETDIDNSQTAATGQHPLPVSSENPTRLVGIITATDEEEQAVLRLMLGRPQPSAYNAQDSSIYYRGEFQKDGRTIPVVLVRTHHQGVAAASNTTTKLLLSYQPSLVVMLGHAAGNRNVPSAHLGDVLIASESVDYHQIELVQRKDPDTGDTTFAERDKKYPIHIDAFLLGRLRMVAQRKELAEEIKEAYGSKELFKDSISCRVGKFVTGGVLMRSEERIKQIVADNPGTIGLDMETHGFYYACARPCEQLEPD